jgi:hypothetical protein
LLSRLTQIDELTRPDHTYLTAADECYYLEEYTARAGFAYSAANNRMQNLKKPVDRRGKAEWHYKEEAIRTYGQMLREALNPEFLAVATIVPVPPSKRRNHPGYDDRLVKILAEAGGDASLDVRELVTMRLDLDPAHVRDDPRSIDGLRQAFQIDPNLLAPKPSVVAVFDDVLTTGAHFAAMKQLLRQHFADVPICGIFLARRAAGTSSF